MLTYFQNHCHSSVNEVEDSLGSGLLGSSLYNDENEEYACVFEKKKKKLII